MYICTIYVRMLAIYAVYVYEDGHILWPKQVGTGNINIVQRTGSESLCLMAKQFDTLFQQRAQI
jgi:hypothetical protein